MYSSIQRSDISSKCAGLPMCSLPASVLRLCLLHSDPVDPKYFLAGLPMCSLPASVPRLCLLHSDPMGPKCFLHNIYSHDFVLSGLFYYFFLSNHGI